MYSITGSGGALLKEYSAACKKAKWPFGDYFLFVTSPEGEELVGSFQLSFPKIVSSAMHIEDFYKRVQATPELLEWEGALKKDDFAPTRGLVLQKESQHYMTVEFSKPSPLDHTLVNEKLRSYSILNMNILKRYQATGVGKATLQIIRHGILDPLVGKAVPIPVYNTDQKFHIEWSPVINGYRAYVSCTNVASLGTQLAEKDSLGRPVVGVININLEWAFECIYPSAPALCEPPTLLTVAETLLAMEKAHRTATAGGSGGASSA